jgi:hypothetical protein
MKAIFAVAAAILLGSISIAVGAEQQTDGIVEDVNVETGTLKLQSGETFTFDDKTVLNGLIPGQRVGVTHDGTKGIGAFNPHPARRQDIGVD